MPAAATIFIIRRRRYLAEVSAHGWTHNSNPSLGEVLDLQAPPFGLGLSRSVDELITGTTAAGVGFRAFAYAYRGAGPKYSARLVALQLPFGLPDAFITLADRTRLGIAPDGTELVQSPARSSSSRSRPMTP